MYNSWIIGFVLISAHYFSSNFYAYYCTPWTWTGFLTSVFRIESIECKVLRWTFGYSYEHIQALSVLFAAYLIKKIANIVSKVK